MLTRSQIPSLIAFVCTILALLAFMGTFTYGIARAMLDPAQTVASQQRPASKPVLLQYALDNDYDQIALTFDEPPVFYREGQVQQVKPIVSVESTLFGRIQKQASASQFRHFTPLDLHEMRVPEDLNTCMIMRAVKHPYKICPAAEGVENAGITIRFLDQG